MVDNNEKVQRATLGWLEWWLLLFTGYNDKLVEIYNKYSTENDPNFAVLYQPANIDILGFPIEALKYTCPRCITIVLNVLTWILFSNIDYFHPSKITHQWIAKVGYHDTQYQCSRKSQSSSKHASSSSIDTTEIVGWSFCPSCKQDWYLGIRCKPKRKFRMVDLGSKWLFSRRGICRFIVLPRMTESDLTNCRE